MDRWDIAHIDNELDFVAKVLYDLYYTNGHLGPEEYLKINQAFHKVQAIDMQKLYELVDESKEKELA